MGILVWLPFTGNQTSTKNKTNYSHDKKKNIQQVLNYILVWRQQEYKKTKQDQWQEDEKPMECQQKMSKLHSNYYRQTKNKIKK